MNTLPKLFRTIATDDVPEYLRRAFPQSQFLTTVDTEEPDDDDESPTAEAPLDDPEATDPFAEEPVTEDTGDNEEGTPLITREEALFEAYLDAEQMLERANEALEFCKEQSNEAARNIFDTLGEGPFEVGGKHVRFVKREGKEKDTYYARKVNPK